MIGGILIGFIVIGAIIGLVTTIVEGDDFINCMIGFFMGAIFGLLVATLVLVVITLASCVAEREIAEEPIAQYEVCSLKDIYGIEGYLELTNNNLEYAYIYEVDGKGLTVGHIPANKTYINPSKEATSVTIYVYTERFKSKFFQQFVGEPLGQPAEYRIVAPQDFIIIVDDYLIDLESKAP